jgi:hypothetical protein
VEIRIHGKACRGDTAFWLMNYSEVVTRIREELRRALCARADAEGREPTAEEIEEVEAAAQSVPTEITIPEEALGRRGGLDVEELILSGFFPVHPPVGARIVQPLMGSSFSPMVEEAVRIRRASGLDDKSIRMQILTAMTRNLHQLDADTRDRTMQAVARALDQALVDPEGTPPKARGRIVKDARQTVAKIVKAARQEGVTEAALREHLATYLAGMRTEMEKMAARGVSAGIVEESLRAYRQVIAEVLGPNNPSIPEQIEKEPR